MTTSSRFFSAATAIFFLAHSFSANGQDVPPPSPSAARAPVLAAEDMHTFVPTHKYNDLSASLVVGGEWRSQNGEYSGTVGATGSALLLLDATHQDLAFTASFRCLEGCTPGILIRGEPAGEGIAGVLYSFGEGEIGAYKITLDAEGNEFERVKLEASPSPYPATMMPFRNEFPGLGNFFPAQLGAGRLSTRLHLDDKWNHIEVHMVGTSIRARLNGPGTPEAYVGSASKTGYGRVGLYVSGTPGTEVHYREVGVKPMDLKNAQPVEVTAARFRKLRVEDLFYSEAVTAADVNLDGNVDVISGPFIFMGPEFRTRQELYVPHHYAPNEYPDPLLATSGDFTGDGYPDIIHTGEPGRPGYLFVNPGAETRRWDKYKVIASVDNEVAFADDVDGDGKLEYVYGDGGYVGYAKAGPDPTQPWTFHPVSEKGPWGAMYAHGLGTGDINGDGRKDFIQAYGWWEQPEVLTGVPWTYHPITFGRWGTQQGGGGGARAFAYDVNGDGLNDVVTSLEGHAFGLAWFEQKRDEVGEISFEQHTIMDDFVHQNNGVCFAALHALTLADVDGDGLKDIVTGKRWWAHFGENPSDPDAFGEPVIYWFKLVRENGEVRFIPELVNNNSGIGTDMTTADLNNDGLPDLMTATRRGTAIFLSQR